jgi:hypothetical protein
MKEYHLHPDGLFIIRENNRLIAVLEASEIAQFCSLQLPEGCTEVLVGVDGIVYTTINKAMEGSNSNPLAELISKEAEIITFCIAKKEEPKQEEIIEEPIEQ